jgi:hypothetical protein
MITGEIRLPVFSTHAGKSRDLREKRMNGSALSVNVTLHPTRTAEKR